MSTIGSRTSKTSETAVAAPVVTWLRDLGWEVYQEVVAGGPRADIVAVRGPLLWVVEAKTSMSMQLLEQVKGWIGHANYVSVAVPFVRAGFARDWLAEKGVGAFAVQPGCSASEKLRPRFCRQVDDMVRKRLLDGQKAALPAGSAGGGYYTPFRRTCGNLREYLRLHPGATLKQAVDGIEHHYATPTSARNCLATWIREGKVPGVAMVNHRPVLSDYEARSM